MMEKILPSNWKWRSLGELSSAIQYGYTAKAEPEPIGPKLLRITDIQNDAVNWKGCSFLPSGRCREGKVSAWQK